MRLTWGALGAPAWSIAIDMALAGLGSATSALARWLGYQGSGRRRNAPAAICGRFGTQREQGSYKKGARVAPSALGSEYGGEA